MLNINSPGAYTGAGGLSAFAASLCCITPVLALFAGTGSIASSFSWIDPARPYLIGLSVITLAFAWYVNLKQGKAAGADCNCEIPKSELFVQSKSFLILVTVFAVLMITFPLYAKNFYSGKKEDPATVQGVDSKKQAVFQIEGMTCAGCEAHVNNELRKVRGVLAYTTSYARGNCLVTYDSLKVNSTGIAVAISKTGYAVKKYYLVNKSTGAHSPGGK